VPQQHDDRGDAHDTAARTSPPREHHRRANITVERTSPSSEHHRRANITVELGRASKLDAARPKRC
jgi:hypothetical protein